MHHAKWVLAAVVSLAPATLTWATEGSGLTPKADDVPWARWQGRLSLSVLAPSWRAGLGGADMPGLQVNSVSLMGDYYFKRPLAVLGSEGHFRATSGLILGGRGQAWGSRPLFGAQAGAFSVERRLSGQYATPLGGDAGSSDSSTTPYLGVGYTGLSARGGWSFSADLGLVALSAGNAVKLGRVFNGTQNLDDVVRDMHVAPVLQFGVSYSF